MTELAWGFDEPHEPGTVCRFPCDQCGEREKNQRGLEKVLYGTFGEELPRTPLYIIGNYIDDFHR